MDANWRRQGRRIKSAIFDQISRVGVSETTSSQTVSNGLGQDRRNSPVWVPMPESYGGDRLAIPARSFCCGGHHDRLPHIGLLAVVQHQTAKGQLRR